MQAELRDAAAFCTGNLPEPVLRRNTRQAYPQCAAELFACRERPNIVGVAIYANSSPRNNVKSSTTIPAHSKPRL